MAGASPSPDVILSFDVEEHHRIEAAARLTVADDAKVRYAERMDLCTRWLLDELARHNTKATFFVVGQIAKSHPALIQAMAEAGHEVASHGWDHRRVHHFDRDSFRDDVRRSKDALEQAAGMAVVGYRAPTFSVMPETAWAIDVLADAGMRYDSSIFPVRHDRYGVPAAPREPFLVRGNEHELIELPIATWRVLGMNLPAGGGGYFRLFPLGVMQRAIRQLGQGRVPRVASLYFHPWEFDPDQERLPLGRLSKWRTYVGIKRSRAKLTRLLSGHRFHRACDVAAELVGVAAELRHFALAA